MSQVSLGEDRLLPRFLCLILAAPPQTLRPDFICSGSGNDIWLLDQYSARLARVTSKGEVLSDFCRGRLSQWINEVRVWLSFAFLMALGGILIFLFAVFHFLYNVVKARIK